MISTHNFLLYLTAVSPVHVGAKPDIATIDLPIQREVHTNIPVILSSSLKGAIREHFRNFYEGDNAQSIINEIFGPDKKDGYDPNNDKMQVGKIVISDAKLLAFPVRSNIAPFIHIISPYILSRFFKDLKILNFEILDIDLNFKLDKFDAVLLKGEIQNPKVLLEEISINIIDRSSKIPLKFFPENIDNLVLISDYAMKYCINLCTEIQTNIKIDQKKGTAAEGSLRYQEFLPSFSMLYSAINFDNTDYIEIFKNTIKDFIQIGANQSTGKGILKINWISGGVK